MKKAYFSLLLPALLLWGCSSDDEPNGSHYTEKQEKVFAIFNGTWADYQFSNLGTYPGANLQPEPDKIVFGSHYSTEKDIKQSSYIDGETTAFTAQGECTYYSVAYKGQPYDAVKCYYNVAPSATILSLWNIEENRMFHTYDLKVVNETEFNLYQSGITLPYIFKKQ